MKVDTMKYPPACIIALCVLLLTLTVPLTARGQEITPDEVTEVMESAGVKEKFLSCVTGKPHPATVDLDLIVDEDGTAALAYTNPVLDPEMFSCLQAAASLVKLKTIGQKYEITYPMEFPVYVTPKPPPGGDPPPPAKDTEYKKTLEYKVALGMTVLGGLMTAGGPAFIVTGVIVYAFMDEQKDLRKHLLYAFVIGGAIVLAGGIALLVVGIKKLKRAKEKSRAASLVPRFGIHPLSGGDGMISTLSWRF